MNIKPTAKRFISLFFVVLLIIGGAVLLVHRMWTVIDRSVYAERKVLLSHLTESSASIVDESIRNSRTTVDMVTDAAERYMPLYGSMALYFEDIRNCSGYSELTLFFVDEAGRYYASDGNSGKIVDTDYYIASSAEKATYIGTLPHLDPDTSYLVLRNRFTAPVSVSTESGNTKLLYCGILCDLSRLAAVITKELEGATNSFIYDDTSGVMLYKQFGIRLLIAGYNIYAKFSQNTLLFGATAEALEASCRNRETTVMAFEIDEEQFYFCSAPVSEQNWSISFIVQSKYLDEISGSAFNQVILYISLVAILLGVTIVSVFILIYKGTLFQRTIAQVTQLNSDLEQATKAKSDFLSNMSHDIRTPINGIMGMTTIAKNVPGNPEKTKECLDKIDGASQHLLSLINDVLDMTRIERGKTEITLKPAVLGTVCDNCCSIIRGQMSGRALTLINENECDGLRVLADDLHLRQIFINILSNAVKFTQDGGTIRFRTEAIDSNDTAVTVRFTFSDTGIGMSPEFLPKVFDTFTQDQGGARSSYKGTGLGMPIAKQLTELMGGTIEVESTLNVGTTFTVTIPFTVDTSTPVTEEALPGDADITGAKLLLAEDNELNMDIAIELLEDAGAIITPVTDGLQALETFTMAAPGTFDAILMDVMMPVMNGIDATEAIRSLPRNDARNIPIIAMTANAFESDIRATREAGMDAHLTKPIHIEEVIRTIAYHIQKQ